MKKLLGSLFGKISAFVLVCLLTPVLFGCIYGMAEAYDEGLYYTEKDFEETGYARRFVNYKLADIREYIYWNDISGLENDEYYYGLKNFAYVIYDSAGREVLSTLKPGITGKPEINPPEKKGSVGYILIVEDYPAKEVNENGKTTAEYTLSGYIKMPMNKSGEGYIDYLRYKIVSDNAGIFVTGSLVLFVLCAVLTVYLICGSGYNKEGELAFRGLNAIDYDIMLFLCGFAGTTLAMALAYEVGWNIDDAFMAAFAYILISALTAVVLAFIMSSSAHFKTPKWWKHTFICQCGGLFIKIIRWFLSNIGIAWKLALCVFGYGFIILMLGMLSMDSSDGGIFFVLAVFVIAGGVLFAVWIGTQLKKIKLGGEAIADGDLDYRTDESKLLPELKSHAENLNRAATGLSKAVDDRMKSERFKTELITNVSHDLKTPLTSIVSYVDLLKKENIENETALEYIEVLDRQSAKLKKLTEDLVEASKASSGAVAVNKETLNIGELINQSVGEFTEKLEAAEIIPVVNIPEEDITLNTDGRLLWRVFDNLIQNIIKYAQPGTRAYFDLKKEGESAVLTIRNISKEQLNVSAEELLERFIRGDASRSSEGNGLGLSIAKSLIEVCGGRFELTLDGDLFKVTVTFDEVAENE